MPELPTLAESGLPGFDVTGWYALLAPAGRRRPIVAKVQADMAAALRVARGALAAVRRRRGARRQHARADWRSSWRPNSEMGEGRPRGENNHGVVLTPVVMSDEVME